MVGVLEVDAPSHVCLYCRHFLMQKPVHPAPRALFLVKAHGILLVFAVMRVVFHKQQLTLSHVIPARPQSWSELVLLIVNFIPTSLRLTQEAYFALEQMRPVRALILEPSWWSAWLIAFIGKCHALQVTANLTQYTECLPMLRHAVSLVRGSANAFCQTCD